MSGEITLPAAVTANVRAELPAEMAVADEAKTIAAFAASIHGSRRGR